jgi:hypothetical protein
LLVLDPKGHLLGGRFVPGQINDYQFRGGAFWPPPVFDAKGFGYSFDASGLVQLRVSLPTP